ncbi:MAG: HD domain-containing protein [Gemmatimonadales bacterium]
MQSTSTDPLVLPDWSRVSNARKVHIQSVAQVVLQWAAEMKVSSRERARWLRSVALHDALKDAPQSLLLEMTSDPWGIPKLVHGPAAAVAAERSGETDAGILDAVRYHSVGFSGWDAVGKILYLADYLEPGRSFHTERHAAMIARVPRQFEDVLRSVTTERISQQISRRFSLLPETVAFWNSLVSVS